MAEETFESDDKTEPATQRRREEARERGHVARSTDLTASLVLLATLIALHFFAQPYFGGVADLSRRTFGGLHTADFSKETLPQGFGALLFVLGRTVLPILAAAIAIALASNWVQVGFLFTSTPLTPTWSKIDPIAGLQRLFSLRATARLVAGLLKLSAIAAVLWWTVRDDLPVILSLPGLAVPAIAAALSDLAFTLAFRLAVALVALGVLDFLYQRWQYERDLRMSKQEIKEEMKRLEGHPRLKERRRAIQRQLAQQRMMQAVPKAAVVVTNPTHFAVALAYDEKMGAPTIVAKGADLIAERIRELADENNIPIVQKPPLAQALMKCDVGKEVPAKLYEAVAEILAYVYSLKKAA